MKGRNASGERNLSSPKGDKRGARIQPPPYRGIRGGLRGLLGLCKSIVIAM